ncbi:Anthranilate synthase component [Trichinella pseudospiralis]
MSTSVRLHSSRSLSPVPGLSPFLLLRRASAGFWCHPWAPETHPQLLALRQVYTANTETTALLSRTRLHSSARAITGVWIPHLYKFPDKPAL